MPDVPDDAATLTAWIDREGDHNNLNVVVEDGDRVYEDIQSDVAMAVENNRYVPQFERPALSLLTLLYREEIEGGEDTPSAEEPRVNGESTEEARPDAVAEQ